MTTQTPVTPTAAPALLPTLGRGIGQIMLQGNAWTGLLFLLGLLLGGWPIGVGTMIGAGVGTFTAQALRFDAAEIGQGLYGFSPALVGAASAFFFGPTWPALALGVIGAALAAWLQHFFIRRRVAAYTLPFILVAWGVYLLGTHVLGLPHAEAVPPLMKLPLDDFALPLNGVGQVIFEAAPVTGLLFMAGLATAGIVPVGAALLGALMGAMLAAVVGQAGTDITLGLFGYNSVLAAITLARQPARTEGMKSLWVALAAALAFALDLLMSGSGLFAPLGGVLTLPFVLAVWAVDALRRRITA